MRQLPKSFNRAFKIEQLLREGELEQEQFTLSELARESVTPHR